ncbi:MAG: hypothetical protein ABI597_12985 [Gammaproteobacteria bacterium]
MATVNDLEKLLRIILQKGKPNILGPNDIELIKKVAAQIDNEVGVKNLNLDPTNHALIKLLTMALVATNAMNSVSRNNAEILQIDYKLLFASEIKDKKLSPQDLASLKNKFEKEIQMIMRAINNGLKVKLSEEILVPAITKNSDDLFTAIYSGGTFIGREANIGAKSTSIEAITSSANEEPIERFYEAIGLIKDPTKIPGMLAELDQPDAPGAPKKPRTPFDSLEDGPRPPFKNGHQE